MNDQQLSAAIRALTKERQGLLRETEGTLAIARRNPMWFFGSASRSVWLRQIRLRAQVEVLKQLRDQLTSDTSSRIIPRVDFAIVGFPKCGTSILIRKLGELSGVMIEQMDGLESPFFKTEANLDLLREKRENSPVDGKVIGHKFTGYVYRTDALERMAREKIRMIVCVRNPQQALVSWREMHRQIARTDLSPNHIVKKTNEKRVFYSEATLEEYYQAYAKERLRYAAIIQRLIKIANGNPVAIVAQESMAVRMDEVLQTLATFLGVPAPAKANNAGVHRGIGDQVPLVGLSEASQTELAQEAESLKRLLCELRGTPNVTVIAEE